MLQNFWALSERGSVLITSRHDVDFFGLATDGDELGVFSQADGADFLLKAIKRELYSQEEIDAAKSLSEILDGLALALNMSIRNFLRFYHQNTKQLRSLAQNEVGYRHSLKTCWATAFQDPKPDAIIILGVLSVIAPDDVPEALFYPENLAQLPEGMSFYVEDSWE
jgi:hypothetical protein